MIFAGKTLKFSKNLDDWRGDVREYFLTAKRTHGSISKIK
jgi:hypothetical protein